eukprot:3318296-Prymnesium_polylepis.1
MRTEGHTLGNAAPQRHLRPRHGFPKFQHHRVLRHFSAPSSRRRRRRDLPALRRALTLPLTLPPKRNNACARPITECCNISGRSGARQVKSSQEYDANSEDDEEPPPPSLPPSPPATPP